MGVTMMRLGDEDSVVAVARSGEKAEDEELDELEGTEEGADVVEEPATEQAEGDGE